MKLIELQQKGFWSDLVEGEMDVSVYCEYDLESSDIFDKLQKKLCEDLEVERINPNNPSVVINFKKWAEANWKLLKAFAKKFWDVEYHIEKDFNYDDYELICEGFFVPLFSGDLPMNQVAWFAAQIM